MLIFLDYRVLNCQSKIMIIFEFFLIKMNVLCNFQNFINHSFIKTDCKKSGKVEFLDLDNLEKSGNFCMRK